ncbi:Pentatricopeptide repeat-containing protein [Quillaja saponaria]|uniref:Pentatricopeptide repeat-containing protein n=1 Tax=Quillaja saponaria TaxID=32244 RepID=A0AAD7M5J0_QUISA|nr:Pentatricopeptide repeat-containing protein [Quillaja saponaria]
MEAQLIQTITIILTSRQTPLYTLKPYIPHLNLSLVLSILSSKILSSYPITLLTFFKWLQNHITSTLSHNPKPLLTVLPYLFRNKKLSNAKSLLFSFISFNRHHDLHNLVLHPNRGLPRLSKPLLDTSIGAYVQAGEPHLAVQIFKKMKRLGFIPNLLTCNTLLNALARYPFSHSILLSREIFKDAIRLGVRPNTNMFNILIYGYCVEKKLKEAVKVLNQMGEFGWLPDNVTYNTVLDVLCKNGQLNQEKNLEQAYDLLKSFGKLGYVLDDVNYETLIMGYFKDEKADKALKLCVEMKDKGIICSIVTYNCIIEGLCQSRKTDQAINKLNGIIASGIVSDGITCNTIIHGYCREAVVEKAFQFHNKMVENSFKQDTINCNILFSDLCKEGLLDKALKLFNTWVSKGKTIDVVTYKL